MGCMGIMRGLSVSGESGSLGETSFYPLKYIKALFGHQDFIVNFVA